MGAGRLEHHMDPGDLPIADVTLCKGIAAQKGRAVNFRPLG
jgi:hypothetical protein